MIDEQQGARCTCLQLRIEQNLQAFEEVLVIEGIGNCPLVVFDGLEEGFNHLDGDIYSLRIIDIGLLEKYHHKDIQQFLVGKQADACFLKPLRVILQFLLLHFHQKCIQQSIVTRHSIPFYMLAHHTHTLDLHHQVLQEGEEGATST